MPVCLDVERPLDLGRLLLLLLLFIGKPQQAFKASLQGARDIS